MKPIPYGRQNITSADWQAVHSVLEGDWLTQGPHIAAFEEQLAHYCGARHAVAVSHGTAALQLVCQALQLQPGEQLWTSPLTFAASANCAHYCGAQAGFVDIDRQSYNLSVTALQQRLQLAAEQGKLPRILIPVHFAGLSCAMEEIARLVKPYGITIVEDACHALGGRYQNQPIGSCLYSAATVFSFHPVKSITTGEGGAIVTNSTELYQRLLLLRSHGITRIPEQMEQAAHGPWFYDQVAWSYNYRLTDLQAALGSSQLQRLDLFISKRRALAKEYDRLLSHLPLLLPPQGNGQEAAHHLYVIRLQDSWVDKRLALFEWLRSQGVGVNVHYLPVHLLSAYRQLGFKEGDFPHAEWYYQGALTLPLYPDLRPVEQQRVVSLLEQFFSK
ncbi:UDP-4-amino-4,6-dideoxy-N-acetyl-beta-L-altrosamine transaminase [Candidatus Magnetaquicoccus inordinatus]|uniref:UDP-4-amino-4, 6-dideoxy-N-acetyl-beta-L-altrosamine transaminase n=1 Tax=Candidatus Magnetaquicoccus inordinatus TaxID=2496818 RepID=UPI00102AD8B2|nr:UDP-4-amino-4,6-dideoxy-N-acetyl-beta-L-altrosamine transaminase [Candidatus Magnetaquicoccus inordinatus]